MCFAYEFVGGCHGQNRPPPWVELCVLFVVFSWAGLLQNIDTLLIDGITLLGNLGLNDHVKALIRMQKGIELIIDAMKYYGHHPTVLDRCAYALHNLASDSPENVLEIVQGMAKGMCVRVSGPTCALSCDVVTHYVRVNRWSTTSLGGRHAHLCRLSLRLTGRGGVGDRVHSSYHSFPALGCYALAADQRRCGRSDSFSHGLFVGGVMFAFPGSLMLMCSMSVFSRRFAQDVPRV
jgi:hypothetical protein